MIFSLMKRNIQLFFRDRSSVFFSLLGPVIMFVLYVVFLGAVQSDGLKSLFPGASTADLDNFAITWVFAGILTIVTATTSLAAIQVFVADRASDRFKDFAVSPIKSSKIVMAYLASTFVISLFMTTIVFILSELYIVARGGQLLTVENAALSYAILVLLCAVFSALNSFIVTFIKSLAAFSSFNIIVGTASGFLAAVYVPVGTLPKAVDNVINLLPFSQAASLMRAPFVHQDLNKLVSGNSEALTKVSEFFGIIIKVGDYSLSYGLIIAILVSLFFVFTVGAILQIHRKLK